MRRWASETRTLKGKVRYAMAKEPMAAKDDQACWNAVTYHFPELVATLEEVARARKDIAARREAKRKREAAREIPWYAKVA